MLKYPCLVLDHDDTVVQSEATVNFPCFCESMAIYRPGVTVTLPEYTFGCYHKGFSQMCREDYAFTEEELIDEFHFWQNYVKTHIPAAFPGMKEIICRQKALGGLVCVVSHSSKHNISRDYQAHFGLQPNEIYGWDYPEELRKPNPYPLLQIMEKYNLRPSDILVVDDMKPAWEMARAAGCKIAFAGWGRLNYPEITQEMTALCDYSFSNVSQLQNFLF